jgi:hypothetical protein
VALLEFTHPLAIRSGERSTLVTEKLALPAESLEWPAQIDGEERLGGSGTMLVDGPGD